MLAILGRTLSLLFNMDTYLRMKRHRDNTSLMILEILDFAFSLHNGRVNEIKTTQTTEHCPSYTCCPRSHDLKGQTYMLQH